MIIQQQRIVITGGTSGIGYELVKQLFPGNELIVVARNPERLDQLAKEFTGIVTFKADFTNLKEVEQVADDIVKRYDYIDLLINNVAVQHTPTFLSNQFCYETIGQEITINFTAVCSLSFLLLPVLLQERPSVILNINSGLAISPKVSSAVYCATKAALNTFSQSLRYQLQDTNIDVLQAFLPLVDTPMTHGRGKGKISAHKAAQQIIRGVERNMLDHDIGLVKMLRLLTRVAPSILRNIMKRQ